MSVDFAKLERKALPTQTFEIEDPQVKFSVSLRRLDGAETEAKTGTVRQMVSKFIAGGWYDGTGKFRDKPTQYPDVKGLPVNVTPDLFETVVELSMMLCEPGETFTPDQLIELSVTLDEGWYQLKGAYNIVKAGMTLGDFSGND